MGDRTLTLRTHLALMGAAAVAVGIMSAGSPVSGHPSSDFYQSVWQSNRLTDGVKWRFTTGFPGGNYRERVKDAAARWNWLGQTMTFNYEAAQVDYAAFSFTSCPTSGGPEGNGNEKDGIHWGTISGVAIGQAATCTFNQSGGAGTGFKSFQIKMDSSYDPWYTGAADPTGGSERDLLGATAHEFGHVTGRKHGGYDGFGHFDPDSSTYCAGNSTHHTMCASIYVSQPWDRSLETHDKDAFESTY